MKDSPLRTCNLLLSQLNEEEWAAIKPEFERKTLTSGEIILEAGQVIASLCFPESGVVSFQEALNDGRRVGVGIVGFEGMVGWPVLLGSPHSPQEATVALSGSALAISCDHLRQVCAERPALNEILLRYVQSFLTQMSRTVVTNLHDPVDRRLARWLLMNHDRLTGDEILLTHEQLGVMLGVRRASVTTILHTFEGEGFVRSQRGRIIIRDRAGLVAFAGESYGAAEAEYARQIEPFAKSSTEVTG